jgi:hypothetical protein
LRDQSQLRRIRISELNSNRPLPHCHDSRGLYRNRSSSPAAAYSARHDMSAAGESRRWTSRQKCNSDGPMFAMASGG